MERKTPKIREITADTMLEKIQKKSAFLCPGMDTRSRRRLR